MGEHGERAGCALQHTPGADRQGRRRGLRSAGGWVGGLVGCCARGVMISNRLKSQTLPRAIRASASFGHSYRHYHHHHPPPPTTTHHRHRHRHHHHHRQHPHHNGDASDTALSPLPAVALRDPQRSARHECACPNAHLRCTPPARPAPPLPSNPNPPLHRHRRLRRHHHRYVPRCRRVSCPG